MSKTYAGANIRALRRDQGLTQAAFAASLGISASYLNQVEKDVRPLSARVLTAITECYGVDFTDLGDDADTRLVAALQEALVDSDLEASVPTSEVIELARTQPGVARAVVEMYQKHLNTRQLLQIVTESRNALPSFMTSTAAPAPARTPSGAPTPTAAAFPASDATTLGSMSLPHEEVRDYFYRRQNYIGALDVAAEDLNTRIRMNRGDVRTMIARRIESVHDVRIVRRVDLPDGIWHQYHSDERRLELSAQLNRGQQAFRIAAELAFLEHGELLDQLVSDGTFSSAEARALAYRGLANYFAAAVMMPYGRFLESAEDFRYDVERLSAFYSAGYEAVCHRLSTLQRPGAAGVPFSFVRVDRAGNMSKRQSASGFHFAAAGGTCPLWNVYESFDSPGQIRRQVAQMPDGKLYLWVSRTVSTKPVRFGQARKIFSVGLGCEARHAHRTVYSQGLDLSDVTAATPIGVGCRLCERPNCPQRAFPPINATINIDPHRSALSPYLLSE